VVGGEGGWALVLQQGAYWAGGIATIEVAADVRQHVGGDYVGTVVIVKEDFAQGHSFVEEWGLAE
jgi:hypothetical protein